VSNRERLLAELQALTSEDLYRAMTDNRGAMLIDDATCASCQRKHGGKCPRPDDDAVCMQPVEDWLDMAWDGTPILAEIALVEGGNDG
jgi:hypothetical protein